MHEFVVVVKSLHGEQSELAESHLLEVEVLHYEGGEVVISHFVENVVGRDAVGGIGEQEHVRLVHVVRKRCEFFAVANGGAVRRKACCPNQAASVARRALDRAARVELLEHSRSGGRDVGLGILLEKCFERFLKFLLIVFGDIGERIEEHKFRHQLRKRIIGFHTRQRIVHLLVAIVEISVVGLRVGIFFLVEHSSQVVDVVGVLHGFAVVGVGKLGDDELAIDFGISGVACAHI